MVMYQVGRMGLMVMYQVRLGFHGDVLGWTNVLNGDVFGWMNGFNGDVLGLISVQW